MTNRPDDLYYEDEQTAHKPAGRKVRADEIFEIVVSSALQVSHIIIDDGSIMGDLQIARHATISGQVDKATLYSNALSEFRTKAKEYLDGDMTNEKKNEVMAAAREASKHAPTKLLNNSKARDAMVTLQGMLAIVGAQEALSLIGAKDKIGQIFGMGESHAR